ncbi:MAG: site-specific integrase [Burkholderiales bacterium]|nr:site-specific integrase [Burkholderiales bacterium]
MGVQWLARVPQAAWIGPRHVQRHHAAWRPFEGALFRFLVKGGYIAHSPWEMLRKPVQEAPLADAADADTEQSLDGDDDLDEKSLTAEEWRYLLEQARLAEDVLARRTELVLWLGFGCGLRASEMCALHPRALAHRRRTWLAHEGARQRVQAGDNTAGQAGRAGAHCLRRLLRRGRDPVAAADRAEGRAARAAQPFESAAQTRRPRRGRRQEGVRRRGRSGGPGAIPFFTLRPGHRPALRRRRPRPPRRGRAAGGRCLGYTGLRSALGAFFKRCAESLAETDVAGAVRLQAATTHWLRHTFATLMLASGAQLPEVQKLLGRSNIATTGKYVRAHGRRMQVAVAVEKFSAELDIPA